MLTVRYDIEPATAEKIVRAHHMRRQGMSLRAIGKVLNVSHEYIRILLSLKFRQKFWKKNDKIHEIDRLMWQGRRNTYWISEYMGISQASVYYYIGKLGWRLTWQKQLLRKECE